MGRVGLGRKGQYGEAKRRAKCEAVAANVSRTVGETRYCSRYGRLKHNDRWLCSVHYEQISRSRGCD